ncbi:hypothetical protein GCM10009750_05510 [Agromyces salentinus]|uniref:Uncharacterized protein n=1 Tax=Agromyces salentinus TaxID=269421 RepID=A0ABP4YRF6_9MICO
MLVALRAGCRCLDTRFGEPEPEPDADADADVDVDVRANPHRDARTGAGS